MINFGEETAHNINIHLSEPARAVYSQYPDRNLLIGRIESLQNGQLYELEFFTIDLIRDQVHFTNSIYLDDGWYDWNHSVARNDAKKNSTQYHWR